MLIIFVITEENKLGIACFLDYHNDGSVYKAGQNTLCFGDDSSQHKSSLFQFRTVKQQCTVDATTDFLLKSPLAITGFVTDEFSFTNLVCEADTLKIWGFVLWAFWKDELHALKYPNRRCKIAIASEFPTCMLQHFYNVFYPQTSPRHTLVCENSYLPCDYQTKNLKRMLPRTNLEVRNSNLKLT